MLKLINQESLDVNEINKVGHNIKYGWMGEWVNGWMGEWNDFVYLIWWCEYDDVNMMMQVSVIILEKYQNRQFLEK